MKAAIYIELYIKVYTNCFLKKYISYLRYVKTLKYFIIKRSSLNILNHDINNEHMVPN